MSCCLSAAATYLRAAAAAFSPLCQPKMLIRHDAPGRLSYCRLMPTVSVRHANGTYLSHTTVASPQCTMFSAMAKACVRNSDACSGTIVAIDREIKMANHDKSLE